MPDADYMADILDPFAAAARRVKQGVAVPDTGDYTSRIEKKFGVAPPALRLFAQTLAGDRSTIDASHFKTEELAALKKVGEAALAKGKSSFGYGDYGEKEPWAEGNRGFYNALTDPAQSLAFTLGMANVKRGDDGSVLINDRYHWTASPKEVDKHRSVNDMVRMLMMGARDNGLLGIGNVIGNYMAPQGQGRQVRIKIP